MGKKRLQGLLLILTLIIGLVVPNIIGRADGVPQLVAGSGGIPRTDVLDVSSWQQNISVDTYRIMKNYGVKGVIVKVSEGTGYINPYASAQINNAKAAGLTVGAYHYSTYTNTSEARAEANYFANAAKSLGVSSGAVMADDLEDATTKVGGVQDNAMAFRNQLKADGFSRPILYTYTSYVSQTGLNLSAFGDATIWIASYPYEPSSSNLWYTQYGMWQFNSRTTFPGVSGEFDVSIDYKGVMTGGDYVTSTNSVYKYGTVSQSGRNDGIYEGAPWNVSGNNFWQYAPQFEGQHVLFDEETKTSNSNGVTWGSWLQTSGIRAYIDEGAISNLNDVETADKNAYFNNGSTGRSDGVYSYAPGNFLGADYKGSIKDLGLDSKYAHVVNTIEVDGVTWYRGKISGQYYWFDSRAVRLDTTAPKSVDYIATINQQGRGDGIYQDRPWEFEPDFVGQANQFNGQDVNVTSEWTTEDGVTWIGFVMNGHTVYMDKNGVSNLR
ncbi:MAG: GW dipeptide domain-containing protein, partial [Lactobacillaceae bacterium]|nr:GW dipeptide domain-containing protein [Lactobacillaceae bacterium]